MLKQLTINSFTLIAEASVPFHEGFTAITGETGAGKSVLMKALRMVCGDKSQASMVRTGEEKAVIEGTFDISNEPEVKQILAKLELDDDDELIIRREILENGKGRARVNGSVVSLSDLQELGESLIQMHGQSEQLLLRDIGQQRTADKLFKKLQRLEQRSRRNSKDRSTRQRSCAAKGLFEIPVR